MLVYGIEGGAFAAGEGLTAPVQAAVGQVAGAVLDDLERLTEEDACTSAH